MSMEPLVQLLAVEHRAVAVAADKVLAEGIGTVAAAGKALGYL